MSCNRAIRTFVGGALVIALSACATQRPFTSAVRRPVLFPASQEDVFDAVLDTIDDEDLLLHRVDHRQGVITTQPISLTRDVPRQIGDLCAPYGLEASGWLDSANYSLRILVTKEGADSSTVEVTPRLRFLLSDTPDKWHDCPVEGPLETSLMRAIEEHISLDPRARGD